MPCVTIYDVVLLRQASGPPRPAPTTSAGADDGPSRRRDAGPLRRYLVAATASRTADEGLAPALALVVAAAGRQPALAGLLIAAVGFPHVVAGPLTGATRADAARRDRRHDARLPRRRCPPGPRDRARRRARLR